MPDPTVMCYFFDDADHNDSPLSVHDGVVLGVLTLLSQTSRCSGGNMNAQSSGRSPGLSEAPLSRTWPSISARAIMMLSTQQWILP
jgi:hypothetical protein